MSANNSNNKAIAKNTIYMYLRMAVMLVVSLYTAGIVFNALGVEDYGTYNIVGSIIIFFSFLNNGLGNATKRYITAEIAKGDNDSRRRVFNSAVLAHIGIAFVILLLAETLGLWIVNSVLKIPEGRYFAANVVYQLSVFSAILAIMQCPFTSAILAYEKMHIYAYFTIFDVVFKLLLIFCMMTIDGDKLIIYGLLVFFSGFINIIIYRVYCYRHFPMCKWLYVKDYPLLKSMFTYTSWSLMGQGAVMTANQGVTFLINLFCGVTVNAAMGVSNSITKVVNDFVLNFQYAFNPQITKNYVTRDYTGLNLLVYRTSRYSSYLVLLFLLPVSFEVGDFLSLWLGDYPKYSVEFCILSLVAIYFDSITAPLWMVLCSDEDIKRYQITVSLIFLLNILFSWIFLSMGFSPYVVMLVKASVSFLLIFARLGFVKRKVTSFSFIRWIRDVLGKSIILVSLPFILTYFISRYDIDLRILRLLIVSGSAALFMALSIFFIGLEPNERQFVVSKIKSKLIKK